MTRLSTLLNHPLTTALSGIVLVASGLGDVLEQLGIDEVLSWFGLHHGVVIVGGIQVARGLAEAADGLTKLTDEETAVGSEG